MKKSKLILLPALAVSLLTGCGTGGGSSDEITIKIWEDRSNKEMVEYLAKDFAAAYRRTYPDAPKISFEFTEQTEKSAIEKMASGIAESGEGPDIAAVTHDTIASGVGNKLIAPASYSDAVKARMTDDAVNAVTVDDVVYGYPITAESMTVMYDKSKVTEAELASFDAIKASGKKLVLQMTGDDGGYYTYGLYTDSILFGEDGKDAKSVDIGTSKSVANVTKFYKEYSSCFEDASPETGANYVKNGTNGIVGLISSPFILDTMKNQLGDNLGIAKLPTINGEQQRPFSGYKAYVVSKYSKHGALAQEICNYITSYDAMAYRLNEKGYLPACDLDADEQIAETIEEDAFASIFAASLADSVVMPNIPEMNNFWRPMNNASTGFHKDAASLTEAAVKTKLDEVTSTLLGK